MAPNPYHEVNLKPTLKKSMFVFIDILGYSDMFEQSQKKGTQKELLERLHRVLTNQFPLLKDEVSLCEPKDNGPFLLEDLPSTKFERLELDLNIVKPFTDNLVIGWPFVDDGESAWGNAFDKLTEFQLEMVLEGFFVRGALSVDEAYMDNTLVFGKALHDTYKAESQQARDPRIILTSSAAKTIRSYHGYWGRSKDSPIIHEVLIDSDNKTFINYLYPVVSNEYRTTPLEHKFQLHKTMVEEKLKKYKKNPTIWSKYV